jgi:hypothetical protein
LETPRFAGARVVFRKDQLSLILLSYFQEALLHVSVAKCDDLMAAEGCYNRVRVKVIDLEKLNLSWIS